MADSAFLARHGATEWSVSGRHTSRTDLPLLPEGEEVARGLAARLAGVAFAELAGFPDAEVCDDLSEWGYGDYEGRTTAEIREQVPGWTVWTHPSPNGESAAAVAARCDRVVTRIRAAAGPVLVVAHGHVLRALAARWLGLPVADGRLFRLDTATLSELGHERETPVLLRWNS
jgi:broad specificity phosphatase PhoE